MGKVADYRILDLGIITFEWTTALYGLVVFLVVIYFMNRWLFKPVINNLALRKQYIFDNAQRGEKNQEKISTLKDEMGEVKQRHWDHIRKVERDMLYKAEAKAIEVINQKQIEVKKEIEEQENLLTKEEKKLGLALKNQVEGLSEGLTRKFL